VRAGSTRDAEVNGVAHRHSIWKAETGSGFLNNVLHAGIGLAGGLGQNNTVKETRESHDLALATVHYGWIFTDVLFEESWFRGNWELLAEIYGGMQVSPNHHYLFGLALLPRYNFATGTPWVPFIDFGAGIALTDIEEPDLSTKFQFILQGGGGIQYFFYDDVSLITNYRFFHLSNANISKPNNSVNTHMLFVGISWFF
jgi:opacity protein-like surface antigen